MGIPSLWQEGLGQPTLWKSYTSCEEPGPGIPDSELRTTAPHLHQAPIRGPREPVGVRGASIIPNWFYKPKKLDRFILTVALLPGAPFLNNQK
jgi:hypothetical protein